VVRAVGGDHRPAVAEQDPVTGEQGAVPDGLAKLAAGNQRVGGPALADRRQRVGFEELDDVGTDADQGLGDRQQEWTCAGDQDATADGDPLALG